MAFNRAVTTRSTTRSLGLSIVLRKTYALLSLSLLWSAGLAYYALVSNAAPMAWWQLLIGMFGLSFVTTALRNSRLGLLAIFAFTGFMGYALGPVLNQYLHAFNNGSQLIMTSLGATGAIFLGLSAYVWTTKKDFSYMGGFITIALLAAIAGSIGAFLFHMPLLQVLIACAFAVIAACYILFTTSQIVNGGETNYIMATISLYVAIFNLFISLLQILSYFSGNSRN